MKNTFKKSISILLTLLLLISIAPTNVVTYAGDTVDAGDGITWSFDGETLVVGGSGSCHPHTPPPKNGKVCKINVRTSLLKGILQ